MYRNTLANSHYYRGSMMPAKKIPSKLFSLGESFENPYLGNKIIEVVDSKKKRAGWIWKTREGNIIVSPHLGLYIWYDENGLEWTMESAPRWLVKHR